MSDPARFVFDLEDFENRGLYPVFGAFMQLWVRDIYIEFLQQGGAKPHVVMRLLTHDRINSLNRHRQPVQLCGCLVSMDYLGGRDDAGEMTIKLTDYNNASDSARAGFRFPMLQEIQCRDVIYILQGASQALPPEAPILPLQHRSDLTLFNFVVADPVSQSVDGCRDIVTQWMVRLNTMGYVAWTADQQSVSGIVFDQELPSWNFHDLIGYNYTQTESRRRDRNRIIRVSPLPLDRGIFLDHRVRRIETYYGFPLPYNP